MRHICDTCGFEARTGQGLGGHRRLKHALSAGRTEDKVSGPTTGGAGDTSACSQRWEALSAEIDDLREFLGFLPDLFSRMAAVEATPGLGQDSTESLPQTMATLNNQVERLTAEAGVLMQLPQRLEQVEAKVEALEKTPKELETDLSQLKVAHQDLVEQLRREAELVEKLAHGPQVRLEHLEGAVKQLDALVEALCVLVFVLESEKGSYRKLPLTLLSFDQRTVARALGLIHALAEVDASERIILVP